MSYYQQLFPIYIAADTWRSFLEKVSHGPGKWILLQALEEGWRNRIRFDLCDKYRVPGEEADVLLNRYENLVETMPVHASSQELAFQLTEAVQAANTLRAYFRYAYYVAGDDPDTIFTILDENLSELGAGTPTRDECASSYTTVTGRPINPDAVVLSANKADEIANHLAAELEDIQRRLSRATETAPRRAEELAKELEKLDKLHVDLTGKSVIDVEAIRELREFLLCSINSSKEEVTT